MKNRSLLIYERAIKSPESRKIYMYSLNEFMKFIKVKEYDDIPNLGTDKIQKHLEDWVMHLSEKSLKAHTIRGKLAAIELFLEMNRVLYHKKIVRKLIPTSDYIPGGTKPFTNEDIQKFLNSTTKLRTKALIHFFASTGVRPASITDPVLRLKHIENMPNGCKAVRVYDGSKEGYWAFLTPEASTALDDYLISRKLNREELSPESPVFVNISKSNANMKNDFMSAKSVRHLMQNLIKSSGVERIKTGNRYDKAVIYGFRKRFNTILKLNNDVNSNIAEKLMAHKRGLDGTYLQPTREECFTEFSKAIEQLIVSDESRDKFKIKTLEKEKSEVEELRSFMLEIKEDQEKFASDLNDLGKYLINDTLFYKQPEGKTIQRTQSGYPKPSEISEQKVEYLMKKFPNIAKTLNREFNN